MLIALDIGNTRIKTGLFKDKSLLEFNSFNNIHNVFEYLNHLKFNSVAISSVVPERLNALVKFIKGEYNLIPFLIDRSVKFNLKISYDSIETLGIDRICSAEGAFSLYKSSGNFKRLSEGTFIISIDFGTATTINIVKHPGEFIGGIISPGIKMMLSSLNSQTAQLPNVLPSDYNGLIARETKSSIASGVINSTVGLIEKSINYLKNEMEAKDIHMYLTGGNAEFVISHIKGKYEHEKALVLYGIKSIYERNILEK